MTEEEAVAIVARAFPELGARRAVAIGSGLDNAAFLIDGRWVFRFPRRVEALPYLENEVRCAPWLAPRLPLPIAAPSLVCRDPSVYPHPFAGHAYLEGETAETIDLSPLVPALAAFVRALHAIEPVDGPPDVAGKTDLARGVARIDRWTASAPDRASILALARELSNAPPHERARWVHGDLYARHLVVRDGALAGVIDWGDVHAGDPALDLSIAFSLDDPEELFDAYGADDATRARARFRALTYGVYFTYESDDEELRALGRRYLRSVRRERGGASRPRR